MLVTRTSESNNRPIGQPPQSSLLIRSLSVSFVAVGICTSLMVLLRYGLAGNYPVALVLLSLSLTVFVYLATLYFLAGKFYADNYYFLLGLAWITLSFHALTGSVLVNQESQGWIVPIGNLVLDFISSALIYFASSSSATSSRDSLRVVLVLGIWMIQVIGAAVIAYKYVGLENSVVVFNLIQVPFAAWALIRAGKAFQFHVTPTVPRRWVNIVSASFYIYAGLQFAFGIRTTLRDWYFVFPLALVTKAVNGVALLRIVLFEFSSLQERLIQRSVFEDIGTLTASIEHDIRNPLGVINAKLEMMRARFACEDETLRTIATIDEQMRRIFDATRLVTVLRGNAEFFEQSMTRVNIIDSVRKAIRLVQDEMAMSTTIRFMLSETSTFLFVKANASMLEGVFVNILKNAIEAIEQAGQSQGVVDIRLEDVSPLVRVIVRDNGCGVPAENIGKLTSVFTTKTNRRPNCGLGLFISDRIIKLHGGMLKIESEAGQGTAVSVFLPSLESKPTDGVIRD